VFCNSPHVRSDVLSSGVITRQLMVNGVRNTVPHYSLLLLLLLLIMHIVIAWSLELGAWSLELDLERVCSSMSSFAVEEMPLLGQLVII
jgi:hypothetical protein